MRLRLIAPVLLVIAATAAGALVLARMDSTADAWLVFATGLALAAVTAALAVTLQRRGRATREVERYFTLSPEMVIIAGYDGYWKRVNPAVEAVLGYTEREALTRPFMEFVHPDDRERTEEEARRVVGGATALAFENRILCKDGSFKLIEWSVKPVPEEGVMYGVGRDITERRRSEREQAALERIATLVAQEAPQADVFGAIAEEIGGLLGTEEIRMLRFDSHGSAIVVASSGRRDVLPLGSKHALEGDSVFSRVLRTGRPERIDDYGATAGPLAETARAIGVRAVVGAPVLVHGRLWGVIATASTKDEPLPPDTESRLARFTDLMATAIANAEAREALQRLADEQSALQRVATLVARDAPSTEVFDAVATEVARLLDTDITVLGRYDDDGAATAIGSWSASPVGVPVGTRAVIGGHNVLTIVAETGEPARVDGYDDATGEAADIARRFNWSSSIAAPVIVEGRLWGVMLVATQRAEPFPAGAEERLAAFTDLVAAAVANAQAHDEVRRFGNEQAALLRVATLVAGGPPPETVLTAVVEEVSNLLGLDRIELVRYDGDTRGTVVAASGDHPFPAGSTWSLDDPSVMAKVAHTRRAARIDDYSDLEGEIARTARSAGFQSAIGAPITVDGRLWGVIIAISTDPEPIPERSETRLGQFTELFATALANAQARAEVERLADEQAALRRVATLVARGTDPVTVLRAVHDEARALLEGELAAILRFHDDRTVTVMAGPAEGPGHRVGTRVAFDPGFVIDWVYETHRAARFDTDDPSAADQPEIVRRLGVRSAVGSPIVVDGELWGVIVVASLDRSLPLGMERRLADFTELVATAIANAESSAAVKRLADEQAALRRVATLVAEAAAPGAILDAVAGEMQALLGADQVALNRFEPSAEIMVLAHRGLDVDRTPVGSRVSHEGENVTAIVRRTGSPARMEGYEEAGGALAELARTTGLRSSVSAPITVEGRVWGVVTASWKGDESPPADTEDRMVKFAHLIDTAIANTEARGEVERLADEQAALHRVATLVAGGVPPEELFAAVAEEVGLLMSIDGTRILRYETDDTATVVARWSERVEVPPELELGAHVALEGDTITSRVYRSGRPARIDRDQVTGPLAAVIRGLEVPSGAGAPIVVEGRLWGVMIIGSLEGRPLPPDAEDRLAQFTGLVATAIANTESRTALAVLADEQAALRRVATLVAEGVPSAELFSGVTTEVAHVFSDADPSLVASVIRFDPGPESVLVGASRAYENEPLGARWAPKHLYVSTRVLRTGRSARVDEADLDASGGSDADMLRLRGFLYQVGSPVVVEGQLWGAMCLNSKQELPPDTEERLEKFTELVATAIANAEGKRELAASRRRIVAASDDTRRRIERDLHDGVQQQLVLLGLELGAMKTDPTTGDAVKEQLASAAEDVGSALDALVEIARGIHPAILTQGGLAAALKALGRRSAVPVEVDARIEDPLPDEVEVAVYYVASEALTNVAKYACASVVHVKVTTDDGVLTLLVRDDGVGGADPGRGSGLVGLQDRVEALGGTITIDSAASCGTCIVVALPITSAPEREIEKFLGPAQDLQPPDSQA